MMTRGASVLAVMLAAMLPACAIDSNDGSAQREPVAAHENGWLIVDWSIDGAKDYEQCDQLAAAVIDVQVTAEDGAVVGQYEHACPSFGTTIDLPAGRYNAAAVLRDGAGAVRTNAVHINRFDILGGGPLTVPIDFQGASLSTPIALRAEVPAR
jgi:hypothetical protein